MDRMYGEIFNEIDTSWTPNGTNETILKSCIEELKPRFLTGDSWLKGRIVKATCLNCTLTSGIPHYTYKKPFDILAKGSDFAIWQSQRDLNPCCRLERAMS